jgi:hypothetical protein
MVNGSNLLEDSTLIDDLYSRIISHRGANDEGHSADEENQDDEEWKVESEATGREVFIDLESGRSSNMEFDTVFNDVASSGSKDRASVETTTDSDTEPMNPFGIGGFLYLISHIFGDEPEKTFYCSICMENCSQKLGFRMEECQREDHQYCRPCMADYLDSQINNGDIEFKCPLHHVCGSMLGEEDIQGLVDDAMFQKFKRLQKVKLNPNYRDCPRCNEGIMLAETPKTSKAAQIRCQACTHVFCFHHSDAHPGVLCETYNRSLSRKTRLSERKTAAELARHTRPCPHCSSPTIKSGGCNHMTCKVCRKHWCWLCGRSINDADDHYSPINIFGCPGGQYMAAPNIAGKLLSSFNTCCYLPEIQETVCEPFRGTACGRGCAVFVGICQFIFCRLLPMLVLGSIALAFAVPFIIIPGIVFSPVVTAIHYHRGRSLLANRQLKNYALPGAMICGMIIIAIVFAIDVVWLSVVTLALTAVTLGHHICVCVSGTDRRSPHWNLFRFSLLYELYKNFD